VSAATWPQDTPAARLLERLDRAIAQPAGGWLARCPAHEDRRSSLKVDVGADGRVLVHCHAGCAVEDVLAAVGLRPRDLFPPRRERSGRIQVAVYDYLDAEGRLRYQVIRYAPKEFRQRRPDGAGGWVWNLRGVRALPYRLPKVLAAARAGATIYVAEGEKDVHALEAAGAVATCNSGGAGKWRPQFAQALAGAGQVVIVADRDAPGRNHARAVAASLEGVVADVRLVEPAIDRDHADVADHLAAGLSLDDLRPLELPPAAAEVVVGPGGDQLAVYLDRHGVRLDPEAGLYVGRVGPLLDGQVEVLEVLEVCDVPTNPAVEPRATDVLYRVRLCGHDGREQTIEVWRSDAYARDSDWWQQITVSPLPEPRHLGKLGRAFEVLGEAPGSRRRRAHDATGIVTAGDRLAFVHPGPGGAIGPAGRIPELQVTFPPQLAAGCAAVPYGYLEPDPAGRAADAGRLLELAEVTPGAPEVATAVLGQLAMTPLAQLLEGGAPALLLYGRTGSFKTAVAQLALQSCARVAGQGRQPTVNLAEGSSTTFAVEQLVHHLAGLPVLLDDGLKGRAGPRDVEKVYKLLSNLGRHATTKRGADRGVYNRGHGGLAKSWIPRGGMLVTVEALPRPGEHASELARFAVARLDGAQRVDTARLSALQQPEAARAMNRAAAGYLAWLLGRVEHARALVEGCREVYAGRGAHVGTVDTYAKLEAGVRLLAEYAVSVRALTSAGAGQLAVQARALLLAMAAQQAAAMEVDGGRSRTGDPVAAFYSVLGRLLAESRVGFSHGGARAGDDGPQPPDGLPEGCTLRRLGWKVATRDREGSPVWELPGYEAGAYGGRAFNWTARIPAAEWPGTVYDLLQERAEQLGMVLPGPWEMLELLKAAGRLKTESTDLWGGHGIKCRYLDLGPLLRPDLDQSKDPTEGELPPASPDGPQGGQAGSAAGPPSWTEPSVDPEPPFEGGRWELTGAGPCVVCDGPCCSRDATGRPVHPLCWHSQLELSSRHVGPGASSKPTPYTETPDTASNPLPGPNGFPDPPEQGPLPPLEDAAPGRPGKHKPSPCPETPDTASSSPLASEQATGDPQTPAQARSGQDHAGGPERPSAARQQPASTAPERPPAQPPAEARPLALERARWTFAPRVTAYLEHHRGTGITDAGAPVSFPAGCSLAELLAAIPQGVQRVMLVGPRVGASAEQMRAWLTAPELLANWTSEREYLDADHPLVVYASHGGEGDRRRVEVRRAAEWCGDRDPDWQVGADPYTATQLREAFRLLADRLPRAFGHGAAVAGGPPYTGAKLLERVLPRGKSYPVPAEEVRELLYSELTQHRIEVCPAQGLAELPGLAYLDGRLMYGALLRELPVGPGRRIAGDCYQPYQRSFYRVRATVSAGWGHLGLLPVKAGTESWEYPRAPGRRFETWASGYEVELARGHGWTVEVLEGLVFDTGEPLRTWGAKLVGGGKEPGLVDQLRQAALTGAVDERVAGLARAMVRMLLLQTIGSFHRRDRKVTYRAPIKDAATLPEGLFDVQRIGDVLVGTALEPLGVEAQRMQHPEWSAYIWSRERVRILASPGGTGALTLSRDQMVGLRGDALYLTADPGWPDDGKLGRLRLKGYAPGPLPVPTTLAELDLLRAQADALGPTGGR
jgi:hypothetical protein